MRSLLRQAWLCRCADRMHGTTCCANQQSRHRSKQVGAERWVTLEHEDRVTSTVSPGNPSGGCPGEGVRRRLGSRASLSDWHPLGFQPVLREAP